MIMISRPNPGLYVKLLQQSIINMGFWDPMSCHYYRWELPPPGISSWTKMRLGWLDPQKIKLVKPGETAEFLLGPLEDGASQILAVKIPLSEKRYYLIENRQPIGFDRHLPGNGVFIMIADDTVAECRQGRSPVKLINADPSIPQLEGAAFDIGKKDSYVDQSNNLKMQLLEKAGSAYKDPHKPEIIELDLPEKRVLRHRTRFRKIRDQVRRIWNKSGYAEEFLNCNNR